MVGAGGSPTENTGEVIWDVEYTDALGGPLAKIFGVVRGFNTGIGNTVFLNTNHYRFFFPPKVGRIVGFFSFGPNSNLSDA